MKFKRSIRFGFCLYWNSKISASFYPKMLLKIISCPIHQVSGSFTYSLTTLENIKNRLNMIQHRPNMNLQKIRNKWIGRSSIKLSDWIKKFWHGNSQWTKTRKRCTIANWIKNYNLSKRKLLQGNSKLLSEWIWTSWNWVGLESRV